VTKTMPSISEMPPPDWVSKVTTVNSEVGCFSWKGHVQINTDRSRYNK
jgi:hypothetical protein